VIERESSRLLGGSILLANITRDYLRVNALVRALHKRIIELMRGPKAQVPPTTARVER
jgi:hypothetical protein